jgi:hypothetical protein
MWLDDIDKAKKELHQQLWNNGGKLQLLKFA